MSSASSAEVQAYARDFLLAEQFKCTPGAERTGGHGQCIAFTIQAVDDSGGASARCA